MKPSLILPALLALALPSPAGTSLHYGIGTDTVDAGGERAASASYALDDTLGEPTVGDASTLPGIARVMHGFIGQLATPTHLALSLAPDVLPEKSTAQLTATAVRDDGTTDPLPPATVVWSTLSGPVATISPGGVVTAPAVYENSDATLVGTWLGLSGQVTAKYLDTEPDNFPPHADDGLDDAWQVAHFGLDGSQSGPTADPDGDGADNLFEWLAGLDPTDWASQFTFRMSDPTHVPGQATVIFGPVLPDRVYTLWWSDDMAQWHALDPLQLAVSEEPPLRRVTDRAAPAPRRFYRVTVAKP